MKLADTSAFGPGRQQDSNLPGTYYLNLQKELLSPGTAASYFVYKPRKIVFKNFIDNQLIIKVR